MLVSNIENKKNKEEKRILLVDDEQDVLLTFELLLVHEGYKVYPFENPLDALANFKSGLYDLAILDIKIPKWTAFDYMRKWK